MRLFSCRINIAGIRVRRCRRENYWNINEGWAWLGMLELEFSFAVAYSSLWWKISYRFKTVTDYSISVLGMLDAKN